MPDISAVEVRQLSDVTNALGNLYRCHLTLRDGQAAESSFGHRQAAPAPMPHGPSGSAGGCRCTDGKFVFYRDIAPYGCVRAPTLFYGDFDADTNRFVLVIEDLGHMRGDTPKALVLTPRGLTMPYNILPGCKDASGRPPMSRALSACGDFLTTRESRIMQTVYLLDPPRSPWIASPTCSTSPKRADLRCGSGFRIAAHFAALSAGPKTVVHGDFRADNMLFGEGGQEDGLALIDWQGFGIGCGMYDVAFFLGTSVTSDVRRRIERGRFWASTTTIVSRSCVENYTVEDCWRSYRQNMLGALMPMIHRLRRAGHERS